ncbi:MAG: putative ABC transport system ATP-binding protein [Rhodothermales bacterium]|jgi:putative ABC transport system ATP-binding protein
MALPILALSEVRKHYSEAGVRRQILQGASLSVAEGEFVALLGRSGSGKSTLLNVIGGLDVADSGSVEFAGVDLGTLTDDERTGLRARDMGFVFQSFNLIPTLTAGENVSLPLVLTGMSLSQAKSKASDMLGLIGLRGREDTRPDRLSGGEQQRVAVARALIHGPRLVLADEPTGNLDYETGRQIMDLLHGMVRERGVSMLVVTHDTDFLQISDRVLQLREGLLGPAPAMGEKLTGKS